MYYVFKMFQLVKEKKGLATYKCKLQYKFYNAVIF